MEINIEKRKKNKIDKNIVNIEVCRTVICPIIRYASDSWTIKKKVIYNYRNEIYEEF